MRKDKRITYIIQPLLLALFITISHSAAILADGPDSQTVTVVAEAINVRIGPSARTPVIGQLQQGDTAPIITRDPRTGWWLIRLDNGRLGWVSGHAAYTQSNQVGAYIPPSQAKPPIVASTGTIILQTVSGGPIYAINPDGRNLRYLTSGIDPILSPDGRQLAFTQYNAVEVGTAPSERGSLWIYEMATGQQRAILGDMYEPKSPTWSPDGSEIVLNFQNGGREQVETRCRDADDTIQVPPDAVIFDVNFGSETGRICFKLYPDTHWALRKVKVNTAEFEDINSARYAFAPTWDPANPWRVVFFAYKDGLMQLDLNRDEYFPFFEDFRILGPAFSPDGSQVTFTYHQHDHWEVYTFDLNTRSLNRLTRSQPLLGEPFNSAAPTWSPDGSHLLFLTDRDGQWEPWIMQADGSRPRPMFPPGTLDGLAFDYHGVHEQLFSWR